MVTVGLCSPVPDQARCARSGARFFPRGLSQSPLAAVAFPGGFPKAPSPPASKAPKHAPFWRIALVLGLVVLAVPLMGAPTRDKIELKTGDVFYGKILRFEKAEISIQLESGGIISFRTNQIHKLRWKSRPKLLDHPLEEYEEDFLREIDARTTQPPHRLVKESRSKPEEKDPPSQPATQRPPASAPSPAATDPAPSEALDSPVANGVTGRSIVDPKHGFSVSPPGGFIKTQADKESDIVLSFRDPLTQASFIVAAYPIDASVVEIKEKVTRSYTGRIQGCKVERDEKVSGTNYTGWLVELKIKSRLGNITVQQLQLFVRSKDEVLVLTYSTSEQLWRHYKDSYQTSLSSLTLISAAPAQGTAKDDDGPND